MALSPSYSGAQSVVPPIQTAPSAQASQPSAISVHDYVRAYPNATPAQVAQATGVNPMVAAMAISDVAQQLKQGAPASQTQGPPALVQVPPPNGAQGPPSLALPTSGTVPPVPASPTPQQRAQVQGAIPPQSVGIDMMKAVLGAGNTPVRSVVPPLPAQPQPAGAQTATTTVPPLPSGSQPSAPVAAPGAMPKTELFTGMAPWAQQTDTLPPASIPGAPVGTVTVPSPNGDITLKQNALQSSVVPPAQAATQPGKPSLIQSLAPLALALLLGHGNPLGAGAFLNNYGRAQEEQRAEAARKAQQEFENQRQTAQDKIEADKFAYEQTNNEADRQNTLKEKELEIAANDPMRQQKLNDLHTKDVADAPNGQEAWIRYSGYHQDKADDPDEMHKFMVQDANGNWSWNPKNPMVPADKAARIAQGEERVQQGNTRIANRTKESVVKDKATLLKQLQSEPDTDKQDALIKAFNDNAKDSDGNQIDYVKMPGEDGTKSYYDPTGAINAKVAAIRAGTDFKDASTAHVKAVTAIIPQQLKMAQQRLAVSQDNLKLAQGKWADSSQNPDSIYYGITPPKSAGDTKQIDKLTQKAVTASNDAGKFSRAADSYFATMQATKEAWEQAHSGDKWETGDSVNYNQMQRQLDMLHQQTLEANDRTTRYNDELKDLAKTMAGLQGNQTLRSVNGKPPPTTTGNASGGQNGQNGQNPPAGNTQTPAKATAQPRIRPVPGGTGLTIDTVTGEIFKNGQSTGHRIKV